ncbi:MAG: glycosyltransferase family 9 protein [Candidatus Marinimicrobia bacterium]|nr:glycosyltransferase family 9 protein [Candidatus Neomarinimicrobiota bacterium]
MNNKVAKRALPQSRRVAGKSINNITDKFRNLLVIRFSSIGDIVLTNSVLEKIDEKYPNAKVDYLTKKIYSPIVKFHPIVDKVINLEEYKSLSELRNKIKNSNYDLIIDLHNSLRSKFITFGLKNVKRYKKHKFQRYLLTKFKFKIGEYLHVTEKYLNAIGERQKTKSLKIFLPNESIIGNKVKKRFAELKKNRRVLGISVGASKPSKMFPIHKWIEVLNSVGEKFDLIVFLGNGTIENEMTDKIEQKLNFKTMNLCSKLTISELLLFVNELDVFIGNDSGISHISAGLGVDTIAIFGQTVPEYGFTPVGNVEIIEPKIDLKCRPCGHLGYNECPKKHHKCMEEISIEKIVNKIEKYNL